MSGIIIISILYDICWYDIKSIIGWNILTYLFTEVRGITQEVSLNTKHGVDVKDYASVSYNLKYVRISCEINCF